MKTMNFELNVSHTDIMRLARQWGWRILRGRWITVDGDPAFQILYI